MGEQAQILPGTLDLLILKAVHPSGARGILTSLGMTGFRHTDELGGKTMWLRFLSRNKRGLRRGASWWH